MGSEHDQVLVKPLLHNKVLPPMGIEPRIGNHLIYLLLTSSPDTPNLHVLIECAGKAECVFAGLRRCPAAVSVSLMRLEINIGRSSLARPEG